MGCKLAVNQVLDFKENFVDKLNEAFGAWGLFVYDHPYKVIWASLILSLIPIAGFVPPIAKWVDGADNLYALPVSEARNEGRIHDNIFAGTISRAQFMTITSDPPGENIFTWDMLEWVKEVDEMVKGKRMDARSHRLIGIPANEQFYVEWFTNPLTKDKSPDKKYLLYEDLCAPDPVMGCKVQSVFEMGIDDMKLTIPAGDPPELWVFDGLVFNTKRKGFSPDFVLGDYTKTNCTRDIPTALVSQIYTPDRYVPAAQSGYSTVSDLECISAAKALNFVYEIDDQPHLLEREMAWESNFYNILLNNEVYGPLRVGANAYRSRDDELSKSTAESADIIFVLYTFILIVSYTTIVNFNFDQYRNKAVTSLIGSVSCLLGLYAGLGVPPYLGIEFVPTALVAPFLVMGVGTDDIFVIISSYALAYGEDTPRTRCGVCLRGCGVSVLMTTVTNVIAFAIGTQSAYLSIKNFCLFTLFALFFGLLYELTLFFAFLCLEARKEEAQQACLCSLPKDTAAREPFDINKVVSTYQVVSVLVAEAVKELPPFDPILHHEYPSDMPKVKRWWTTFSERGRLAYKPDQSLFAPSRETSTADGMQLTSESRDSSFKDAEMALDSDKTSLISAVTDSPHMLLREPSYMKFMSPKRLPFNRYDLHQKLKHEAYRSEPKGNVGRRWRHFFVVGFSRYLLKPWVKVLVLIIFTINLGVLTYGFTCMNQGLEMKDLAPDGAYLKTYDQMQTDYMNKVDLPVEVFYPSYVPWHEKRAIDTLRMFVNRINGRPENFLLNDPLTRIYDDPLWTPSMTSGNKTEFYRALKRAITEDSSAYKQFELDFVWKGDDLLSFRQQLLPAGTKSSKERASWMTSFRSDSQWAASLPDNDETVPIEVMFYNYMLVFYESDIQISSSVIASLSTASMAMLVIAILLIPDLYSGLIVIIIMLLIDMTIIGYMSFWDVNLNMISMVILVISIGFAVDYSAHITYAFVNGIGPTRDIRATEAIVLVGTPLFHGATANFLGIMLLGFSTSYILRIFFKMMTLVVLFGITHGMLLLPVILSLFGAMGGSIPIDENDEDGKKLVRAKMSMVPSSSCRSKSFYEVVPMSVLPQTRLSEKDGVWYRDGVPEERPSGKVRFAESFREDNSPESELVKDEALDFSRTGLTPFPRRRA